MHRTMGTKTGPGSPLPSLVSPAPQAFPTSSCGGGSAHHTHSTFDYPVETLILDSETRGQLVFKLRIQDSRSTPCLRHRWSGCLTAGMQGWHSGQRHFRAPGVAPVDSNLKALRDPRKLTPAAASPSHPPPEVLAARQHRAGARLAPALPGWQVGRRRSGLRRARLSGAWLPGGGGALGRVPAGGGTGGRARPRPAKSRRASPSRHRPLPRLQAAAATAALVSPPQLPLVRLRCSPASKKKLLISEHANHSPAIPAEYILLSCYVSPAASW